MARGGGIKSAFERYLSPFEREEQGLPPDGVDQQTESNLAGARTSKTLTLATTDANALIPAADKLLIFRALSGIDTVPALTRSGHARRTAPNIGIYTRTVRAERAAGRGYRLFSIIINVFLGVQIIVAAILTALGAANGSHVAVTAFGAINTIIAGAMTYLKGSGLPDRFRYQEQEWKVVREYIEQREREFCLASCPLDVYEELAIVEDMYKKIKTEIEGAASGGMFGTRGSERAAPTPARPNSTVPARENDAVTTTTTRRSMSTSNKQPEVSPSGEKS